MINQYTLLKVWQASGDRIVAMPIFWRLMWGYLAILLLSVAASSYSVIQLGQLSNSAHSALNTENQMIAYQEKLTDVFLSEVRYAGKFIITHANPMHDQLQQFKGDFVRYMDELKTLAESAEVKERLARIEEFHLRYHELFDQELRYIKATQTYAVTRYREEKEKVLASALAELGSLKAHLQKHLRDRLGTIEQAALTTRSIAIASTLALLGLGIALSFAFSSRIVRPLSELTRTTENMEADFDRNADLSRMPEIFALATALSKAKRKLQDAARANASFVHSVTDQFATPLISIHRRLSYMKEEVAPNITTEQTKHIEIMAAEMERLIGHFCRLPQQSAAPVDAMPEPQSAVRPAKTETSVQQPIFGSASFYRRSEQKIRTLIARAQEFWARP